MIIREASTSTLKRQGEDDRRSSGLRVLTTRRWPRGVSWQSIDLWVPSAGPSQELLAAWHAQVVSWEDFLAQYRLEQERQFVYIVRTRGEGFTRQVIACGRSIDYLAFLARKDLLTLYCIEQDQYCHRFLLATVVDELVLQDTLLTQEGD